MKIALLTLALLAVFSCTAPRAPKPAPVPAPNAKDAQAVIDAVNAERARTQLPPLAVNPALAAEAQRYAQLMADRNQLSHFLEGNDLLARYRRAGFAGGAVGENIAWNQRTPQEAVSDWMGSPGHRANILNAGFSETGVGVAVNSRGERYWCQAFGGP